MSKIITNRVVFKNLEIKNAVDKIINDLGNYSFSDDLYMNEDFTYEDVIFTVCKIDEDEYDVIALHDDGQLDVDFTLEPLFITSLY